RHPSPTCAAARSGRARSRDTGRDVAGPRDAGPPLRVALARPRHHAHRSVSPVADGRQPRPRRPRGDPRPGPGASLHGGRAERPRAHGAPPARAAKLPGRPPRRRPLDPDGATRGDADRDRGVVHGARDGRPALTLAPRRWSTGSLVDAPLKRTPLYEAHVKAGARLVPFGGWEMPVQYAGIIEEHRAVRSAVGLFDVSHMGEFEVDGEGALAALQTLTTNDVSALDVGQVQYSLLCYPEGGIADDLTISRLAGDRFMLTVNAANIDKDWAWVTGHAGGARWKNVSSATGLIAVQGPRAETLVGRLTETDVTTIAYYRFASASVAGVPTIVSRTGYTGEDGFELYVPAEATERLWNALLDAGSHDGVAPIGLGARDTLRLEMAYALYGNDIDQTTYPLEAGLGRT